MEGWEPIRHLFELCLMVGQSSYIVYKGLSIDNPFTSLSLLPKYLFKETEKQTIVKHIISQDYK
jgi:hypothetical protein